MAKLTQKSEIDLRPPKVGTMEKKWQIKYAQIHKRNRNRLVATASQADGIKKLAK